MASETEPAKLLLPYLQRADELQQHELLVSYYCRLYAMERGLRIPQNERTKTTNSLLISLMNQLEKDKKSLQLGPEDNLYVEGFALNVFGKADQQDRAGRADLNTAKTFYAASIFFEVLNQFGVLQPDLEQKQKYAAWKAVDIRKALKEGRRPNPGPPSGEDDLSIPSTGTYDVGPSESPSINSRHEPDPPQFHDSAHDLSTNIPPPPHARFYDNMNDQPSTNTSPPAFQYRDQANDHQSSSAPQHHFHDEANNHHFINLPSVPQTYPTASYPSHDFPPPPGNRHETSDYPQPYHHQSYGQEPSQHLPHSYSPESTSYSYPHFQSYPSFSERGLPAVPPDYPSYSQGSDGNYAPQPSPSVTTHKLVAQFQSSRGVNGSVSEPTQVPAPAPAPAPALVAAYEYDCNYQPPPEKLAEAQNAARFAVGALAFDEVPVAVDFLRKSLELLTNPSAKAGL